MAANCFEVPENETWKGDVSGLLVAALAMGENGAENGSKWDVYWGDSGALRGRKKGGFVV
jgi:hypothetical protein